MAQLVWRRAKDGQQYPARAVVRDGMSVFMEGRDYDDRVPSAFDLYRTYSPLLRWYLRKRHKPEVRMELGDTYAVTQAPTGTYVSEAFPLSASGVLGTHRWLFTDRLDHWSPMLRAARFVDIGFGAKVGTSDKLPVSAGTSITGKVASPGSDPTVHIAILLPWTTAATRGLTVQDALRVAVDPFKDMVELLSPYLPDGPTRWEVWPETPDVVVDEGSSTEVDINVRPGDGGIAMALAAFVDEDPDDRPVMSDVVVLDQPSPGQVRMLYAESDGEPATLD
jgi:hypothetical protein